MRQNQTSGATNMTLKNTPPSSEFSIVDSHQHFWQLSRGDYKWLSPQLGVLYKDYLPEHLHAEVDCYHVKQTVLVQAAATEEETHFLLRLAYDTNFVAGVVGWINFEDINAVSRLEQLAASHYLKGVRPMLQDIEDPAWILNPEFTAIFNVMENAGLTLDALVRDVHLYSIETLAKRHPDLKIVIDHCAKPDLTAVPSALWQQRLANIAKCTNVHIKFSGLMTESPKGEVSVNDIRAVFELILNAFGPDRIMWGSDWPVVNLNGSYDEWFALSQTLLNDLPEVAQKKICGLNAQKFYCLTSV